MYACTVIGDWWRYKLLREINQRKMCLLACKTIKRIDIFTVMQSSVLRNYICMKIRNYIGTG